MKQPDLHRGEGGDGVTRRRTVLLALAVPAALYLVALKAAYLGTATVQAAILAQSYFWLFSIFAFGLPSVLVGVVRSWRAPLVGIATVATVAGGLLLAYLWPAGAVPDYCVSMGADGLHEYLARTGPPARFHCRREVHMMAGGLAGWWLALGLMAWRDARATRAAGPTP